MVVLFKGYNNHSNRLFQAIHLEAFCLEHGLKFYNPSFWRMKGLYGIDGNPFDAWIWLILCSLNKVRLLPKLKLSKPEKRDEYEQVLLKKKLVFVHGWWFFHENLTQKFQKQLVKKYSLLPELYENNALYQKVLAMDRSSCHLVGVHVRKGDYETWKGGMYYFTEEVYQLYMDRLRAKLLEATGKPTIFLVFSNESVQMQASEDLLIAENAWYVDQKIMSCCDLLIGPPSTFTKWASYLGNVGYYHITNDSGDIHLDAFETCNG